MYELVNRMLKIYEGGKPDRFFTVFFNPFLIIVIKTDVLVEFAIEKLKLVKIGDQ